MTTVTLAQQVGRAMYRARALAAQRKAAAVLLERCHDGPTICEWAHSVLRCDEPRPYKLLYRIADRGGA